MIGLLGGAWGIAATLYMTLFGNKFTTFFLKKKMVQIHNSLLYFINRRRHDSSLGFCAKLL